MNIFPHHRIIRSALTVPLWLILILLTGPAQASPPESALDLKVRPWYTNYFKALAPQLKMGGCITAHNVLQRWGGIRDYLAYVNGRADFDTTIDRSSSAGISISCKTAP